MYQQLSHGEGVGQRDWLLVRVVSTLRADMVTTRIGRSGWSQRAAKWRLAGACQRSSRNEWGYVGKRAFDKAFLSNHRLRILPLTVSVGHQGQRCRALLI